MSKYSKQKKSLTRFPDYPLQFMVNNVKINMLFYVRS
jgi:hypothetical protein